MMIDFQQAESSEIAWLASVRAERAANKANRLIV